MSDQVDLLDDVDYASATNNTSTLLASLFNDSLHNVTGNSSVNETYCGINPHDYLEAKFFLISVVGTAIALFGVFGNVTTTLILTRPSMRSPNNLFLTALAVFDSCLLVTAFMIYAMEYIIEYSETLDLYVAWLTYLRFMFALSHISQTGSVYTTVAVTVERYLAVVYPQRSQRLCTRHGAAFSVLGVTAFAILFNCTKFFELEVVRNPKCPVENFQSYLLLPGALGRNDIYSTIYTLWLSNIVMVFFPFLCLLVLNSVIAIYIRNSLKRLRWAERITRHSELKEKSRDATLVLVVIVFIFLLCNFWGFVLTLYERIHGVKELAKNYHRFYTFSREAVNFLAIINSSINFVIYCIFGKDFRRELVVIYGCGTLGMTLMLPGGDRFSTWRHTSKRRSASKENGKRAKKRNGSGTPNIANVGMRQFSEMFAQVGTSEEPLANNNCSTRLSANQSDDDEQSSSQMLQSCSQSGDDRFLQTANGRLRTQNDDDDCYRPPPPHNCRKQTAPARVAFHISPDDAPLVLQNQNARAHRHHSCEGPSPNAALRLPPPPPPSSPLLESPTDDDSHDMSRKRSDGSGQSAPPAYETVVCEPPPVNSEPSSGSFARRKTPSDDVIFV